MTIDERLEALTQSVELLATLHRDLERETAARFAETAAATAKTEERMGQLMETMNRLGNIIISHEQRI
jgi:non-ribosomal peptide synthetase component F